MTQELFEKAKFGDRFVTRGGQEALFLRLTENSEWRFADFYVKDWGLIRVNRENGKCLNGPDIENDIVGMMPSLPANLDEAAEEFGKRQGIELSPFAKKFFKRGAEWMAWQGWSLDGEVKDRPTGGDDFEIYLDYDRDKMENILDKICDYVNTNYPDDDNRYKVIIQIRKTRNLVKT